MVQALKDEGQKQDEDWGGAKKIPPKNYYPNLGKVLENAVKPAVEQVKGNA
jgi:hypothetical protein